MTFHVASINTLQGNYRKELFNTMISSYNINYDFYDGVITENGYSGLFLTVKEIIEKNINSDYIIFCEDDLILTKYFSIEKLNYLIEKNKYLDALITGCWFGFGFENINQEDLIKIRGFKGTQLVVIYKKAYKRLLIADINNHFEDTLSYIKPYFELAITVPFLSKQRIDIPSLILKNNKNNNYLFDIKENELKIFKEETNIIK